MSAVKASVKLALFALLCVPVVLTQPFLLMVYRGPHAYHIPYLWHRSVCAIFGIRFKIIGKPATDRQTIYMSNHLSYLDIPMIGSLLKASFVAKKEVESWPVFGFLSKLQQTEFIERKRTAAHQQKQVMSARLASGQSLIIFPEGTSTSGESVLPFKSSLFTLAMDGSAKDLYVQPMTISLVKVNGKTPENTDTRNIYAWPRDLDMPLHEHLWRFACSSGADLTLTFHPPLRARDYDDRKILAKACHDNVSKGLEIPNQALQAA